MKLSYVIVALATIAVAYAGSVDLKVDQDHKITITPKAAPITAPPVKDPCHKILSFRTEKSICIQEAFKGECAFLPDYASGGCAAAGFPLCCQSSNKEQAWYEASKCPPAAPDVCPKNLAAPIMKLVKKNAKFQKLLAVWDDVEKATDGGCPVPGHCGRVYQGCCFAAKGKEFECKCKLSAGDGQVGEACEGPTKAGACADAYAACCFAYKRKGFPCTCDIALPGQSAVLA